MTGIHTSTRRDRARQSIEQFSRDFRHACRAIVRAPILASVVILSLAVGIGVNTVVFSWIQAVVLRPLPGVAGASAFHVIEPRTETGARPGASWLEYRDLQERVRSLTDLLAFRMVPLNVGEASRTERTYGLLVSGNYFSALRMTPAAGRFMQPDEAARGEPVVVIGHAFWQTRYGGAASVIGQSVRVNDRDLTIVGVTPENFQGTVLSLQFDLWVPAALAPSLMSGSRELEDRSLRGYSVMGRLPSSATRDRAQSDVDGVMRELARIYPNTNQAMQADVLPFWRATRGPQTMLVQGLAVLQAIMLLLLLAVCGNTANLLLARASARHREVGIRLAMGAGSWRVVRLLLMENVVMALVASGLGLALAMWGTTALRAMPLFTTAFPVRFQTSVNEGGLMFGVVLAIVCALVFGAAPALHLGRLDPQRVLRTGGSAAVPRRMRNALMAIEVALATAVLVVAGLFLEGFRETRDIDPGFRREGVLLAAYDLTGRGIDTAGSRRFASRLLTELRAIPDVEAAAIATQVPLDIHGLPLRGFRLEGRARADAMPDRALSNVVTPGYFDVMGIALLGGADFADLDDTAAPPQAIVNEAFVRRYVEGTADGPRGAPAALDVALGRRIEIRDTAYTITGIVRDSLYESFSEGPTPIVYLSYRNRPSTAGEIHLGTRAGGETLLAAGVRHAVRAVDPSLPVYNVRTMTDHVEMNLVLRRIPARMFIVLGPLLLALAAIGIYAVVSYTVAHRTSEIGIRVALGATARRVVLQIVRESLRVIVVGAVAGWAIVYMLYIHLDPGKPLDLVAFVAVPAILLLVATAASWLPARRAATVDPVTALRQE